MRDDVLELTRRSGSHDIPVRAPSTQAEAHALHHAQAAERLRDAATRIVLLRALQAKPGR